MSLLGKKKGNFSSSQPIFETIEHRFDDNEIAYRYPSENFSTKSLLFVYPGQEAILVMEGKIASVFTEGRYELNTDNIPLLDTIYNIPYGGEAVFRSMVIFINKDKEVQVRWGTKAPISLRDPGSKRLIQANGRGQFSVRINDSGTFLAKSLGQLEYYSVDDIADYIFAKAVETITSKIGVALQQKQIPLIEIVSRYTELSDEMYNQIVNDGVFERYGFRMNAFSITDISMSDSDWKALQEYENKYLEDLREVDVLKYKGDIYDKQLSADILKTAAANTGSGGMMNMGMGLGMGLGIGTGFGGAMNNMAGGMVVPGTNSQNNTQMVICAGCQKPIPATAKFCQFCGKTLMNANANVCSKCNTVNPAGAVFCSNCGNDLRNQTQIECPACKTMNDKNSKFCCGCGKSLIQSKLICPKCNCENDPSAAFCNGCGTKLGGD